MTTMFHDVHRKTERRLIEHRVPGAEFDEVTYADDTMCITTDTRTLNEFAKNIEREGLRYGVKLNKGKCELITTHPTSNFHFEDGPRIKQLKQSTDLGCEVGIRTTHRDELNKRFINTMITMKSSDIFWRQ